MLTVKLFAISFSNNHLFVTIKTKEGKVWKFGVLFRAFLPLGVARTYRASYRPLRIRRALKPFNNVPLRTRAPFHKDLRLIVRSISIVAQWQIVY